MTTTAADYEQEFAELDRYVSKLVKTIEARDPRKRLLLLSGLLVAIATAANRDLAERPSNIGVYRFALQRFRETIELSALPPTGGN